MISKIILIYCLGLSLVLGAIILNYLAGYLGLTTWYNFLNQSTKTDLTSYLWLFILYPICLGLLSYFLSRYLNLK